VPWLEARRGRQEAVGFFGVVANLEFHEFQVTSLLSNETEVVATVLVDATWKETGVRMRDEEIHLWTFGADGKVTRFRHYCDTAKHMKAAGKG
jgi:ketosteroid isomerase-like protein